MQKKETHKTQERTKKQLVPEPKKNGTEIVLPPNEFIVDRTRLIDDQQCPRLFYWAYGWDGIGLQREQMSVYLARGIAFHAGVALLLTDKLTEDACIQVAIGDFEKLARKGLDIEKGEDNPPALDEQLRLIEGALWAFTFTILPRIKARYNILDIEREEAVSLGEGVTLLARTDALLEHKIEKTLHIWSLKTTKTYDERKEADGMTDVQGLSEALAVEERMKRKVKSIQMCYFVLGKRDTVETDIGKETITRSPFCYGYRRVGGGIGQGDEYYAERYWKCDKPHITTHTKKASECPGGKTHKIGDDFEMFPIDEYPGGIKQWIEDILSGEVKPGRSLIEGDGGKDKGLIFMPSEYFRQERDIQSFKRQAYWQAKEIQGGLELVKTRKDQFGECEEALDVTFRQHKHRCNYPGECDFKRMCFPSPAEREDVLRNPLKYGYKRREVNHPAELQTLRGGR